MTPISIKKFISFEGIDFSGKSTQIHMLMDKLQPYHIRPVLVREPGGTEISEKIREILLNTAHSDMGAKTEILLYEAARAQLVSQKIIPLLQKGNYVIADRFHDSTTAYQGTGRELDMQMVKMLNQFATSGVKPYRTFFIDISPQEAENRRLLTGKSRDRLESGGIDFFIKVRESFLILCDQEPNRFVRIDGERSQQDIAADIWQHIRGIWSLK